MIGRQLQEGHGIRAQTRRTEKADYDRETGLGTTAGYGFWYVHCNSDHNGVPISLIRESETNTLTGTDTMSQLSAREISITLSSRTREPLPLLHKHVMNDRDWV